MTTDFPSKPHSHGLRLSHRLGILLTLIALGFVTNVSAEAPSAQPGAEATVSTEQLVQLVGPIALYPDDLVAIILPASTNPLQLVQADRFLDKRKADPKLAVDDRWDDAVKSLLNYPDVVKKMSGDLDWTTALGEAVVTDQGAVLEAVQVFRRQTQSVGNLKSDDKQTIIVEKEVIKIVQADPQVIYVPQYEPSTVIIAGQPSYAYYPSPYPVYYYPYAPGAAFATGLIWGAAIGAAWNGGHYNCDYHGGGDNNINIDRSTNISNSGNKAQQWKSNKQPGQVRNSTGAGTSARVGDRSRGDSGFGQGSRGDSGFGQGSRGDSGFGQGSRGDSGFGQGSRGDSGFGQGSRGDSAFGGGSGRQSRMDSARGASSRGSMSGGGSRSGSVSRGGGGGGRSGGGGRGGGGGGRGGRR